MIKTNTKLLYQQEQEGKSLEIALRRRTPIENLVWDGRKDTFCTVQGQQKIEMLSDSIITKRLETASLPMSTFS
jgi:hypothetical protein